MRAGMHIRDIECGLGFGSLAEGHSANKGDQAYAGECSVHGQPPFDAQDN
jgi:hypothetical protein